MSEELPPDDEAPRRSSYAAPVWFVVVLIVGYPLSIGPAQLVYNRLGLDGTLMGDVLMYAYLPLAWLRITYPGSLLDTAILWWSELWAGL